MQRDAITNFGCSILKKMHEIASTTISFTDVELIGGDLNFSEDLQPDSSHNVHPFNFISTYYFSKNNMNFLQDPLTLFKILNFMFVAHAYIA